jgi:isopentenyl-diphosphate delta-isomerase
MTRELDLVELVDPSGATRGTATVTAAHTAPGQLHRAFSVLLVVDDGQTLLQQRAASKTRFPLRWANACCGHPAPGTSVVAAAEQRLAEELGIGGISLVEVGVYTYRADDPTTGRVEHEFDHVVVGRISADQVLRPDPAEVAETRWAPALTLASVVHDPSYAPWLPGVLPIALARPLSE